MPDPATGACGRPFHDASDLNHGGPHGHRSPGSDIDRGKMDGFIAVRPARAGGTAAADPNAPICTLGSERRRPT